jgi:DNA-binding transcriptional regulator YiaG
VKPSASSRSAGPARGKRGNIVAISVEDALKVPIDWKAIDATTEADIARHAREDGTETPSDREWAKLVRDGLVTAVLPSKVDVRAIREKLKLSQIDFAARFGFTASAVRQWEQGRRHPHGPARVLLTIIAREPGAVRRALDAGE